MTQHQDIPALSQYFIEVVAASGDVNSLSTVRWYRTRLKTFLSWTQANPHVVLDDSAFNAFALHLKQRVADKTLSRDSLPGFYRVLRRFGKWLHAEGYVSRDPARALKAPRPNKKNRLPKALSDDEIEKLLAATEGMPREAAMVRCLHRSGARVGELLQLRWGDIVWEAYPVWARVNGKGDILRPIFFAPDAVEALRQYRDWLPDECSGDEQPVWWGRRPNQPWRPLKYSGFYQALKRLAKRNEVEHFNPHRWRHAFALSRRRQNQSLSDVQDLMGHSSPETTKIYDSMPQEELGQAYLNFVD
jgi:integrase/recombinase XerD